MERLTKRISEATIELSAKANPFQYNGSPQRVHMKHPFWNVFNRLCAYEDAEEQGLLIRLPCKVGDTIWQVTSEVHKYIVTCIAVRGDGVIINTENYETGIGFSFNAKRIGQRYFLTKEEAEQKLAEYKGE